VKTRRNRKIHEREALLKRRRQQRLEGLPEEESPSKMASEEEEDSDDNDTGSRYDTVTFLRTSLTYGPYRDPSVGGRPPRHRGQPRCSSRGRKNERKGGPMRGPQKGDPPSLGSL
jgi:hypothetical protein